MVRKPVEIFFSYAHRDEELRDELVRHLGILQQQRIIQAWHDRQILPGSQWADEIDAHLDSADIILLLISSDFLYSDYCYGIELRRAMERHYNGEARVIPVILRPVDWQNAPFSQLQALPRNAKPVTKWTNRDEAFTNVAQGIRTIVEAVHQHNPSSNLPLREPPREPPREPSSPPAAPSIHHTRLSIVLMVLGWSLATVIGGQVEIPQQIVIAGGVGGLMNGFSINMRLRLIDRAYAKNQLQSIALWTIGYGLWGWIVGWMIESSKATQSEGVLYVVFPGFSMGVLFLIWQLKRVYDR